MTEKQIKVFVENYTPKPNTCGTCSRCWKWGVHTGTCSVNDWDVSVYDTCSKYVEKGK